MTLWVMLAILAWHAVANGTVAAMYWWDKRAAGRGGRRIPEAKLLLWSLVGGWPAGLVVGRKLRHKTAKRSFRIQFFFAAALHVLGLAVVAWWAWK